MEDLLTQALDAIPAFDAGVVVVGAIVLEGACRVLKTKKPIGVLHSVRGVLIGVGNIADRLVSVTDQLLPQRIQKGKKKKRK